MVSSGKFENYFGTEFLGPGSIPLLLLIIDTNAVISGRSENCDIDILLAPMNHVINDIIDVNAKEKKKSKKNLKKIRKKIKKIVPVPIYVFVDSEQKAEFKAKIKPCSHQLNCMKFLL